MKRFKRYDRSLILFIITVVSITGVALINNPDSGKNYWKRLNLSDTFEEFKEYTLDIAFRSSLAEIDEITDRFSPEVKVKEGFEIKNNIIDVGLIYHAEVNGSFDSEYALREMLNILSEKYQRIRRENIQEKRNDQLLTIEESGLVFNEFDTFNYLSKIIIYEDEAWLIVLTFDDQAGEKVREFLDNLRMENKKGVKLS